MGTSEKFCLRWNDFESNISGAFRELREDKDFFDVTLACDDDQMQAHKVILSACSPFFGTILKRNRHEHPLLYLKGVKYADLVSVLNFMYHGEVNVAQEELNSFLAVAEDLKLKGLTQNNADNKSQSSHLPEIPKPRVRDQIEKPGPQIHSKRPHPPPGPPVSRAPPRTFQPDDDIQEVLPIKSEPISIPAEAPTPTFHLLPQQAAYLVPKMVTGVVADPNMKYADEYGDYEGYDGADASYDGVMDDSGLTIGAQDGTAGYSTTRSEVLAYNPDIKVWECTVCGRSNSEKNLIRRHAEVHFKGFIHTCPHCGVEKKTSTALRVHKQRFHTKTKTINELILKNIY